MNGNKVHGSRFAAHGSTWMVFLIALAVAAVTLWVYWPCLEGGILTNMDDDVYMAAARQYGGLTAAGVRWAFTETRPYYHPLTRLTHLLAYNVWGAQPAGHHAVNLVLHAANAALVTVLAWILLGLGFSRGREASSGGEENGVEDNLWRRAAATGFVGVAFAVHPLQAETVSWIAGRTQLLCAMLMLGCVLAYVKAVRSAGRRWWWTSAALYVLAWLAKPMVATLPVVLLVLDWYPLGRDKTVGWRRLLLEKLWMFAISIGFTLLAWHFAARQGVFGETESLGWVQRAFVAECALGFYVWKFIWPTWLSPFYPAPRIVLTPRAEFVAFTLLLVAIVGGLWLARRRVPALAAVGAAYISLLLPMSGLTQFGGESIANRHMYVAMLPFLLGLAGAGVWLGRRARVTGRATLIVAAVIVLVCAGMRTHAEVRVWHDDETLWREVLRWFPNYGLGNLKVALAAIGRRDYEAALPYAERALEASPDDENAREVSGFLYLRARRYDAAAAALQPLVRADTSRTGAAYNLACAYAHLGSNDAALVLLGEVSTRDPRFANLAQRDPELAGLRLDPRFVQVIRRATP